jgi:hypothetical protein
VYVNLQVVALNGTENVTYDGIEVMLVGADVLLFVSVASGRGVTEVILVGADVLLFVSVASGRGVTEGDRYAWARDPVAVVISTRVVDI